MSIFDSLRRFFGIQRPNISLPKDPIDNRRNFPFDERNEGDDENVGFNVFSNPLEMQRYFEREMESFMKSFGLPDSFFGSLDLFRNTLPEGDMDRQQLEQPQRNIREHYLKPGFQSKLREPQADSDIDGRLDVGEIETILKGHEDNRQMTPCIKKPIIKYGGQSLSISTITKPDGSVETRRTMCDNDGNIEKIVTHKFNDKVYTTTTKVDKDGNQEIVENLINMDESEIKEFMLGRKEFDNNTVNARFYPNWSLFDKFFR